MSMKATIPNNIKKEILSDPFYDSCALYGQEDHICGGRITWEHAIKIKGIRIQKRWAIIPLCAKGHEVDEFQGARTMIKDMNEWVALSRVTTQELLELFREKEANSLSKTMEIMRRRQYLIGKFGPYVQEVPENWK